MNAREVALAVVRDVFPPSGVARTAQASLEYRARQESLDPRDRAFATELTYGAIKMRRALDWQLQPFLGERATTIPQTTREVLRLAVFELRYTKADEHATVHEFVEIAKRRGHRGLAALTNAVLRSFLRAPRIEPTPEAFDDPDEYFGTAYSLPTWLVRQWRNAFGGERLDAICAGVNAVPQSAISTNLSRIGRAELAQRLLRRGVEAAPSPFAAESIVLATPASSARDEAESGLCWTQSESSAMAVEVLNPQPAEHVADLCSGRGNKALQIASRLAGEGELFCADRDDRKMRALLSRFERLSMTAASSTCDVRELTRDRRFDRALLDAPCSGLGVVGRHPEARWKKECGDGERLAVLQAELLAAAAPLLHAGGVLVYAVCSTDPREGEEVVNGFLARNGFSRGLVPASFEPFLTEAGDVLVAPGIGGRDGFYIARLERSL